MAANARDAILTVPNLVSSSRLALAVGFVLAEAASLRLALLAAASLTDVLDGWLARRARTTSRFGALLDPVADRTFMLAVVGAFLAGGHLRPWQAVAVLFRDVMSVVGYVVARRVSWLRPITFRARPLGKAVTVLQVVLFAAVLLVPPAVNALVIAVALLGVAATADYTLMLWRERDRERWAAAQRA